MNKEYKCCICHKVLDYKPIRLVKQKYPTRQEGRKYQQYYPVAVYDFCERCYKPFEKYIDKYREELN